MPVLLKYGVPSICSTNCRSLRIVYSAISNWARSSFSGGIESRPEPAYSAVKSLSNSPSASSAIARIARSG